MTITAQYQRILISRTDSIGDVVLTLPMAGLLRQLFPKAQIFFLGQTYTCPVIEACEHIDEFYNWDDVKAKSIVEQAAFLKKLKADIIIHIFPRDSIARAAKRAKIPVRLGTANRFYHWRTCNKLIRLSRKKSPHHEAQLNLKLLEPLGAKPLYSLHEIAHLYGLTQLKPLNPELTEFILKDKTNLIIHPTSKGSAMEWGMKNFAALMRLLPAEQFNLLITGTESDGERIRHDLPEFYFMHDLTGKLTLDELISLIAQADGLVAASTGPLHLAAALGKYALGLYPSRRPMHPGRWAPVGINADFVQDGLTTPYQSPLKIQPQSVAEKLKVLQKSEPK